MLSRTLRAASRTVLTTPLRPTTITPRRIAPAVSAGATRSYHEKVLDHYSRRMLLTLALPNFGVPCLTLRENTERPITVTHGTNVLVGVDPANIVATARQVFRDGRKEYGLPDLWDGAAATRIVEILAKDLAASA